eukprot:1156126-Pelagomonas_calceolata.AAC.2
MGAGSLLKGKPGDVMESCSPRRQEGTVRGLLRARVANGPCDTFDTKIIQKSKGKQLDALRLLVSNKHCLECFWFKLILDMWYLREGRHAYSKLVAVHFVNDKLLTSIYVNSAWGERTRCTGNNIYGCKRLAARAIYVL